MIESYGKETLTSCRIERGRKTVINKGRRERESGNEGGSVGGKEWGREGWKD